MIKLTGTGGSLGTRIGEVQALSIQWSVEVDLTEELPADLEAQVERAMKPVFEESAGDYDGLVLIMIQGENIPLPVAAWIQRHLELWVLERERSIASVSTAATARHFVVASSDPSVEVGESFELSLNEIAHD